MTMEYETSGYADGGFPIVRPDFQGMRVAGYIGFSELEHALGVCQRHVALILSVRDESD